MIKAEKLGNPKEKPELGLPSKSANKYINIDK